MENINFIEPDIFLIAGTLIILFLSVFVIFLYQLFQNSKTLKEITNIKKDIFNVSKLIEIQNSQSTQVNNNFEIIVVQKSS